MPATTESIEDIFQRKIAAMNSKERMARTAAMCQWARDQITRQIRTEQPDLTVDQTKWQLALRLYGDSEPLKSLIQRKLEDVSS